MKKEKRKVREPQPKPRGSEQRDGLTPEERRAEEEGLAYESFEINPEPYIDGGLF